ncbi:MAG: hypothetical protein QOG83_2557 [Alphaproteobacteria bacterium]|jgi:hypothetical protein|nr:hypothetical protein [Alphaproteobacteria bacterium]
MKHLAILSAAALLAALPAVPAQALSARTFVSGQGSDTNPCLRAAPCRTFAAALAATSPGGEIDVLDPAGYGVLTIDKAISIVNDGVGTSSILVPAGAAGIIINAPAGDAVHLRGLTIESAGNGLTGIRFNTGASLTIEDCVIRHATGIGIEFMPNASSGLLVSNTLVADNAGNGILILPSGSGTVTAVFNRVEMNNNGADGIFVFGGLNTGAINVTVADSVAARNNSAGFAVLSNTLQAPTTLSLFHSVSANNGVGIQADGAGAKLRVAQSMVTGNATNGWIASGGGLLQSYGDNYIDGNGSNTGVLTGVTKQ